jgi:hypothetical protein
MAREKNDGMVDVAVRCRNAGVSKAANASGNSRDNPKRNAGPRQLTRFLSATAEYERVSPFQAQDTLALPGKLNEPQGDVSLMR